MGSFVNLDRQVVARGLQRLLDQGVGTMEGGVPSFSDTDMRKFLTAKNIDTPTTIPNQPLEDTVGTIAIDSSLKLNPDLSSILSINDTITELTVRKNEIAALNLDNIKSDPLVASAKAQLDQANMDSKLNFVRSETPIIERRIQEATAALLTAQDRARENAAIKTASEVADIDNRVLVLENRRLSLEKLIARQEEIEPQIPVHVQQALTEAEGITDLQQIQKTWDTLNDANKQMIKQFASLPDGKFFPWHDPIVQDIDRDGMISMIKSRLSVSQGQAFTDQISQFDKQLQDAQAEAAEELIRFQGGQAATGAPPMNDDATRAWINNRIGQTMDANTGAAFDTFTKRAVPEAITREGFSSEELWRVAQTLQANLDPTIANLQGAVTSALTNMPPMDKNFRDQLIKEYMRGVQNTFNSPRVPFGLGINQVTIDTLADDISSRMNRVDMVKEKQELLKVQLEALGLSGMIGEPGPGTGRDAGFARGGPAQGSSRAVGGAPDTRAGGAPTTIITTGQTPVDVALSPILAARQGQPEDPGIIAARARTVQANNPGLTDQEAAMIATGDSGGLSSFLNDLNPEEISLVVEQLRNASVRASDPGEQNMLNLLLKKLDRFAVQSRQPEVLE